MKRFLSLFLLLAVLVSLKAEEKAVATKECKCEAGQKDCPCLAQVAKKLEVKEAKNSQVSKKEAITAKTAEAAKGMEELKTGKTSKKTVLEKRKAAEKKAKP